MHRVYSAKRGIEFKWGVKDIILAIVISVIIGYVITHIDQVLAVLIAGF